MLTFFKFQIKAIKGWEDLGKLNKIACLLKSYMVEEGRKEFMGQLI